MLLLVGVLLSTQASRRRQSVSMQAEEGDSQSAFSRIFNPQPSDPNESSFSSTSQTTINNTQGSVSKSDLLPSGTLSFDWSDDEIADNITISQDGSVSSPSA